MGRFLDRAALQALHQQAKKAADRAKGAKEHAAALDAIDGLDQPAKLLLQFATEAGDGDPVPALLDALNSEEMARRAIAAQVFALLGTEVPKHPLRTDVAKSLLRVLEVEPSPPLEGIEPGADPGGRMRMYAAQAMGKMGYRPAVGILSKVTRDPHRGARQAAVRSLGLLGEGSGIPAIAGALDDPDPEIRDAAIAALKQIGTNDALTALERWQARRRTDSQW